MSSMWQPPDKSFTKEIISEGFGLVTPNDGSKCMIQITPLAGKYHLDEDIIGYPLQREIEVCIGDFDAELSENFDICLESMQEGERCQIRLPKTTLVRHLGEERLNSSMSGIQESLTDDSTEEECVAKFDVELKSVTRFKEVWRMSAEEKIERSDCQKQKGTACFQNGKTVLAAKRYSKAVKLLITVGRKSDQEQLSEKTKEKFNALKCSCLLNLSACLLKLKQYENVVLLCTEALTIDAKNVKAFYRRGQALIKLNEFDGAKEDLTKAQELEPQNKAIRDQMSALLSKVKQQDKQYAAAMSKMFGGPVKS